MTSQRSGLVIMSSGLGCINLRDVSKILSLLLDPCFLHHVIHHLDQLDHLPATTGPPSNTHTYFETQCSELNLNFNPNPYENYTKNISTHMCSCNKVVTGLTRNCTWECGLQSDYGCTMKDNSDYCNVIIVILNWLTVMETVSMSDHLAPLWWIYWKMTDRQRWERRS